MSFCGGHGINTAVAWDYPKDNIVELIDEPDYLQPTRTNIVCLLSYRRERLDNTFAGSSSASICLCKPPHPKRGCSFTVRSLLIPDLQTPLTIHRTSDSGHGYQVRTDSVTELDGKDESTFDSLTGCAGKAHTFPRSPGPIRLEKRTYPRQCKSTVRNDSRHEG